MSNEVVVESRPRLGLSALWKLEDYWAIWLGALLLGIGLALFLPCPPDGMRETIDAANAEIEAEDAKAKAAEADLADAGKNEKARADIDAWFAPGFAIVFGIAVLAFVAAAQSDVKSPGVGYAAWAIAFGLLVSNTVGTPEWVKPAVQTEFYI